MKDIETLKDRKEILEEINKQNKKFDKYQFYIDGNGGALSIITPIQTINVYSNKDHKTVAEKTYREMYDDFESFDEENIWQIQATSNSNIVIQHTRFTSIVWIPEKITLNQFEQLFEFNKNINFISENYNLNGEDEFEIITNVDSLSLNDAIQEIAKRIDNNLKIDKNEQLLSEKEYTNNIIFEEDNIYSSRRI